MKAIITADIHFGLQNKTQDIVWALRTIDAYAKNNDIDIAFILGDLFHDRTSLDIEALNVAYDFFSESSQHLTWIVFPGNHDMFLRHSWDINSLRIFNDKIIVIDDVSMLTVDSHRFWIVPFVHYENVYMKIIDSLEEKHSEGDFLLTHIGVNKAMLNECYALKYWNQVDFTDSKFDRIYAGHFHCAQQVGNNLWYPGSPIPYRFDEGLVEHGFYVLDCDSRDHEFIKTFQYGAQNIGGTIPPDYITISDDDEINLSHPSHVRVSLARRYNQMEYDKLRERLIDAGALSVKWMNHKRDDDSIAGSLEHRDSGLSDPIKLFERWIEHDNPDLDHSLLKRLNKSISG